MMTRKLLAALAASALVPSLCAGDFQKLEGVRFFVGPSAGILSLGGDFNGTNQLYAETFTTFEAVDVDHVKTGAGPGVSGGMRFSPFRNVDLGFDVGSTWSRHSVSADRTDTLRTIDFNFRTFFGTRHRVQPSLLAGVALYDLREPNADSVYYGYGPDDEGFYFKDGHFTGAGVNLGVGLTWFILTRLSVDATFIWRQGSFNRLNDEDIHPPLIISAPTGQIALLYHFGGHVRPARATAIAPAQVRADSDDFQGKLASFDDGNP